MNSDDQNVKEVFHLRVAELYPELTPEQQAEAEYYLIRYFEIINAIYEEKYGLTSSDSSATV
jgi:hypothetical protein